MIRVLATTTILASVSALPAVARVITLSFTGTISDGYDYLDVFGLGSGANLTGQTVTVTFTYDTTAGDRVTGSTNDYLYGGALYGRGLPGPVTSVVKVNGVTLSFDGLHQGYALAEDVGYASRSVYYVTNGDGTGTQLEQNHASCNGAGGEISPSLETPYSTGGTGISCQGFTELVAHDSFGNNTLAAEFNSALGTASVAPAPSSAGLKVLAAGVGALAAFESRRRRNA